MEPSDFDRIIKQKISQENNLYQKEIAASKPFVWSEIKSNEKSKAILIPWYYAAAVIIILLLGSSWFFLDIQNKYHRQIDMLSQQINQQPDYYSFDRIVELGDEQLDFACNTIDSLQQANSVLKQKLKEPNDKAVQIVYKVDTVFVKQIEYITEYISPIREKRDTSAFNPSSKSKAEIAQSSNLIYPDFVASNSKKSGENTNVKLKLNTLTIH